MSDKEDRESARKTLKTAKKGSASYIEAIGILSGDDPEKREYRKTTKTDDIGMMGGGYMKKNMKVGGSLEMVKKNGKEVPFYAADGVGKMAKGGKVSKAMGGGKVYKYGHGGGLGKTKVKRISKNETNGNKIVDDCYKNYV